MEEKKTTKRKGAGTGWTELLLESVFKGIQTSFDGAVERGRRAVQVFVSNLVHGTFLFFFALFGFVFLLVGLAKFLSTAYQLPGIGETFVGAIILVISLVLYIFYRSNHSMYK